MNHPIPLPGVTSTGPHGSATRIRIPTTPAAAACVITFLIDAPWAHPLWSQYVLSVVDLKERPGLPAPVLKFPGATHELIVFAINPGNPPRAYTPKDITDFCVTGDLPFLTPVNIAEQFQCTDEEISNLAYLAAAAVTQGQLNPEVADAPAAIRMGWLQALTKTLAHLRGEAHAR